VIIQRKKRKLEGRKKKSILMEIQKTPTILMMLQTHKIQRNKFSKGKAERKNLRKKKKLEKRERQNLK